MTQLHTYAEARLGRWVLWCRWGVRPGPNGVVCMLGVIHDGSIQQPGRVDTPCPVDITEAEETHRSWLSLDPDLREAVHEAYIRGGTVEQQMRALGIKSTRTYYKRLERAYVQLLGYFNDLAAGVPLPKPLPREQVGFVMPVPAPAAAPVRRSRESGSAHACGFLPSRLRIA